jgi:hypothetical protein
MLAVKTYDLNCRRVKHTEIRGQNKKFTIYKIHYSNAKKYI